MDLQINPIRILKGCEFWQRKISQRCKSKRVEHGKNTCCDLKGTGSWQADKKPNGDLGQWQYARIQDIAT